jgi:hypothetical protein
VNQNRTNTTKRGAGATTNVRPFVVDPKVAARIHPLRQEHIPDVVRLHRAAMGDSLWARLGAGFLTSIYELLLQDPEFIGFVYIENNRVRGFIAGSADSEATFRNLYRRHKAILAWAALKGILRHPAALGHLLTTPRYFRRSQPTGPLQTVRAESLFCSFEPDLRGKRISGHINKFLFDEFLARGHQAIKITCEADNRGAVRQVTSWGFQETRRFHFYGKEMITWVLDLQASPRVEPIRRHAATGP